VGEVSAPISDRELAERYRRTYHVDGVGAAEAKAHWALERRLTQEIWESTPENRWETFSRCYTALYAGLPWLNETPEEDAPPGTFAQWARLLPEPSDVFEVGSGRAELLRFLSASGHRCTATEITPERGSKHAGDLRWFTSDGVHLADFIDEDFDVVVSTGVIEHLHPADVPTHFEHAHRLLRPGGRYLLTTPHAGSGPHDLSVVFKRDRPECMHLKEYDYTELTRIMGSAGFSSVRAVFPPARVFRRLPYTTESRLYLAYLRLFDLDRHAPPAWRRRLRRAAKLLLVPDNIWISARV
jgi:SAM-dependent methyltransferase